jgi:hypothetical protein
LKGHSPSHVIRLSSFPVKRELTYYGKAELWISDAPVRRQLSSRVVPCKKHESSVV